MLPDVTQALNHIAQAGLAGIAYGIVQRQLDRSLLRDIIKGLIFAFGAVVFALLDPMEFAPGVLADERAIYVGMAAAFLRPAGWATTLSIVVAARLAIGGAGAWAGVASVVIACSVGVLWQSRVFRRSETSFANLVLLGLLLSAHLLAIPLLPAAVQFQILTTVAPLMVIHNLLGAILFGSLLLREFNIANRERVLTKQTLTDPLSGLGNRLALELAYKTGTTSGSFPSAVMMIDIDLFKSVNDQHGHDAGDIVLRQFATLLRKVVRAKDCVARFGGEEFVVYLPATDADHAVEIAERIRAAAADHIFEWDRGSLRVTVSIGVACAVQPRDLHGELARADAALYRAKAEGRNAVRLSDLPPSRAQSKSSRLLQQGATHLETPGATFGKRSTGEARPVPDAGYLREAASSR